MASQPTEDGLTSKYDTTPGDDMAPQDETSSEKYIKSEEDEAQMRSPAELAWDFVYGPGAKMQLRDIATASGGGPKLDFNALLPGVSNTFGQGPSVPGSATGNISENQCKDLAVNLLKMIRVNQASLRAQHLAAIMGFTKVFLQQQEERENAENTMRAPKDHIQEFARSANISYDEAKDQVADGERLIALCGKPDQLGLLSVLPLLSNECELEATRLGKYVKTEPLEAIKIIGGLFTDERAATLAKYGEQAWNHYIDPRSELTPEFWNFVNSVDVGCSPLLSRSAEDQQHFDEAMARSVQAQQDREVEEKKLQEGKDAEAIEQEGE